MSGLAAKELPGNDRQGDRSDDDHNNNREDVIGTHILSFKPPFNTTVLRCPPSATELLISHRMLAACLSSTFMRPRGV